MLQEVPNLMWALKRRTGRVPKGRRSGSCGASLSPQVVVTDEISHPDDGAALAELARSGVKVLASCHGDSLAQVKARSWAQDSLPVSS